MITYTQEPLSMCQDDIESLLPAQWQETGDSGLDCLPNWPVYRTLDEKSALIVVMARDDNRTPIGYLTCFIYPHPNSKGATVASIPTYFIMNRPGRALLVRSLLSHGQRLAVQRGVYKITVETEYNHSAGRILEAMGMVPAAVKYVWKRDMQEAVNA